jgi:hypothetical protein
MHVSEEIEIENEKVVFALMHVSSFIEEIVDNPIKVEEGSSQIYKLNARRVALVLPLK